MSTPANKVNTPATAAPKGKKGKKPPSAIRTAAELAYKNAKSDQEKAAARGHLKVVRFRELVVPRVNRAVKLLAQIEKLANRSAYTWTDEEAAKVCKALQDRVTAVSQKFTGQKSADSFAL